jgi:hypothetical protein
MRLIIASAILVVTGSAVAASGLMSFADAKKVWDASRDRKEYQDFSGEFVRFNNQLHLDTKDNCYALGKEPVELMLVIAHPNSSEQFAVVQDVLADVDSAKARCFKKSYNGVSTKVPPFVPFVLQMTMG